MKKKILIIHTIAWTHYAGLVFSRLYKLSEKYDLLVIHLARNSKGRKNIGDYDKELHQYPHKIIFDGYLEDFPFYKRISFVLREIIVFKPDVLITAGWSDISIVVAAILNKIIGGINIVTSDSTLNDKRRVWYKEFIKKIILKFFDAAFCIGSAQKKYLMNLGFNESKIFIAGWYIVDFNSVKGDLISDKNILKPNNFIFVGRLSLEKNIKFLLKVFKDIKTSEPKSNDWGLIIVGDGPQRKEIEDFIKENNLEKDIYLAGGMSWKEVPKYYALADIFVLPSLSEPWGLVVNEAMVCGLPVIVSRKAGAYWDLVKEGENGFGFEPTNPDELKSIMLKFIKEEVDIKKMGEKSKEIIKDYSPGNAARQMLNAVDELLMK